MPVSVPPITAAKITAPAQVLFDGDPKSPTYGTGTVGAPYVVGYVDANGNFVQYAGQARGTYAQIALDENHTALQLFSGLVAQIASQEGLTLAPSGTDQVLFPAPNTGQAI